MEINTSSILVEYTINPVNGAILSIEISHPNGFEIDEIYLLIMTLNIIWIEYLILGITTR